MDFIKEYELNTSQKSRLERGLHEATILLEMEGGVGDMLMTVGGTAYSVYVANNLAPPKVVAAVKTNQVRLAKNLCGVHDAVSIDEARAPTFRNEFDYHVNFRTTFNNFYSLKPGCYYKHVSEKAGIPVSPGRFIIPDSPKRHQVAIHPGASNPNRRWAFERWGKVALSLRDAGYEVVWLGCKEEYGFRDDGIIKLSDINEDLWYQTFYLYGAKYFLGNDSGFAHIAGLLGVPGSVIFSATAPEDVIGKYENLDAIHAFDKVGPPTRSLDINDVQSYKAIDAVTVGMVLQRLGVSESACTVPNRVKEVTLAVRDDYQSRKLVNWLAEDYDIIKEREGVPVIYAQDECVYLRNGDKLFRISAANPEILKRGIMESLVL